MKELVKRLEKRAAHVDTESFKYELFPDEIARLGRLFLCLYQAVTRLKDYLK